MEIKTTKKQLDAVAPDYVRVRIVEKGTERMIVEDGVTFLEIVSGKYARVSARTFRTLVRTIVRTSKAHNIEKLALELSLTPFPKLERYGEMWVVSTIVENLLLAGYEYTAYKSKKPTHDLSEILICNGLSKDAKMGFDRGMIVGTYANVARDLANTPGGDMTPTILAKSAQKLMRGTKAKVRIIGERELKAMKAGGILGVGKGAKEKPCLIVIEYDGRTKKIKDEGPLVLVGKGITFDTGGLNIKPGMSMYEMHMDMSGGASVIAALAAVAKLGIKKQVIGLIPAAENSISADSIRPGDVLTMLSGKKVDVLNTDAEGRLILADALHYARRYNPKLVVDVATLTGAALVALGQHAHAIMTKSRKLEDMFRDLGERSGDYVFPLPLWSEYKQYTKGVNGDIANIPVGDLRFGGTITAGMFLAHFTKGMKWVHIDMAPRMTSVASDKLAKGATGEPTRLLVTLAEAI